MVIRDDFNTTFTNATLMQRVNNSSSSKDAKTAAPVEGVGGFLSLSDSKASVNDVGQGASRIVIQYTEEEKQALAELREVDSSVRRHEMAHKIAGGRYCGPVTFQYVVGPDGRSYAKGGHVDIDTSEAPTPEATVQKAEIIHKAALAPTDPSPQDHMIAAQALQMAHDARAEMRLCENAGDDASPVSREKGGNGVSRGTPGGGSAPGTGSDEIALL